jgi:hypothetical protein
LVDRAVNVAPLASDLHIRLVDLPAAADGVAARPGGVGQQYRKAEHPPVDSHVVDLDTALGEQLLDITVGQPEAQVPADSHDDDIGREPESGEGRAWRDLRPRAVSDSHDGVSRHPPVHSQRNRAILAMAAAARWSASCVGLDASAAAWSFVPVGSLATLTLDERSSVPDC